MADTLVELIAELKEKEVLDFVDKAIEQNVDPMEILNGAREGMQIIGDKFAEGTYFLPDLIYSGEILKSVVNKIEPLLKQQGPVVSKGKVVLGTVAGDIHNIGKDIVGFMLDVNGYEVHDLGVDVSVQDFVKKIRETDASIVALSGFLTLAFDAMKATVDAIADAGLREQVKIMVGGGQIDEQVRQHTGADAFGRDAIEAVKLADDWIAA